MTLLQIAEICVYDIIDIIFCVILALIPFRGHLTRVRRIAFMAAGLYLTVVAFRVLALLYPSAAELLLLVRILLYLIFYKIAIRAELVRILFVLLLILNYTCFVGIIFNYAACAVFGDEFVKNPYSLRSNLLLLIILVITYPFVYRIMDKKVNPVINASENKKLWNIIWLVPAVFCMIYYYSVFTNGGIVAYSQNWKNMLLSALMNIGFLFVTYLVIRLVEESNANLGLKIENYKLAMQTIQYENLNSRIEEARRARHDLRHSIMIIQSYLNDNDKEGLKRYINQFVQTLPSDTPILYCDDYVLNAVIFYYAELAKQNNIVFQADVQYSSDVGMSDTDVVVLFGNLLENAVDACIKQTERARFIRLKTRRMGGGFIITLDNSYEGIVRTSGDELISSKSGSTGIGTTSIREIAGNYQGVAKLEFDERVFHSSVMLNL